MVIQVENLNCYRGDYLVLQGLKFTVQSGQCLILRGPNGSGKTTLLRQLAGLGASDSPLNLEDMVFGGHLDAIKSALTVEENLQFWAGIYGCADIQPIADKFDLIDLTDRAASTLSAGQKRRLGLARFLISGAQVWLMDEPTVSLDAATTKMLVGEITQHIADGGSAIISTHIDLLIDGAKTLDVTKFAPTTDAHDPFLEGSF